MQQADRDAVPLLVVAQHPAPRRLLGLGQPLVEPLVQLGLQVRDELVVARADQFGPPQIVLIASLT